MLEWDNENANIIFAPYSTIEMVKTIGLSIEEAPNDIQLRQINLLKRSRNGQRKLKQNLLKQYSNRCCVTGCDVEVALNACHIEPHRLNGYNDSKNALLLRTDIHALWDKNLIGIHPVTLEIHTSPKLHATHYASLANRKLAMRNDLALPSENLLKDRWRVFLNVG
jgi:predicted restriction endonuclease